MFGAEYEPDPTAQCASVRYPRRDTSVSGNACGTNRSRGYLEDPVCSSCCGRRCGRPLYDDRQSLQDKSELLRISRLRIEVDHGRNLGMIDQYHSLEKSGVLTLTFELECPRRSSRHGGEWLAPFSRHRRRKISRGFRSLIFLYI